MLLRRVRLAGGLTQTDVSKAAHLSHPVITAIENGGKYKPVSLEAVALALGLRPGAAQAYLAGDDTAIAELTATAPAAQPAQPSRYERIMTATPEELVDMRDLVAEFLGEDEARRWLAAVIETLRERRRAGESVSDAG